MFTARHFEKTAQVLSKITNNQVRHEQTMLWRDVFVDDNRAFKPDMFEKRVEFLHSHAWEFALINEGML